MDFDPNRLSIGVVIPCRQDVDRLKLCLASLRDFTLSGDPLVVVHADGEKDLMSADFGAVSLRSPFPGRGWAVAHGLRYLLRPNQSHRPCQVILIAHADMIFQTGTRHKIIDYLRRHPRCPGGALGHTIMATGWPYRLLEWGNRWRAQMLELPYGDQGQFFRAELLNRPGGFPAVKHLEDLELALTLQRYASPAYLDHPATISPRHWSRGIVRATLRNWALLRQYVDACGMAAPEVGEVVAKTPVALVLVAKVPRAGRVKTRMIGPLSAASAAAVHGAFMRYWCAMGVDLANSGLITPILYIDQHDGDTATTLRNQFRQQQWHLLVQSNGNLSKRLTDAARVLFRRGHQAILFIGADSPDMRAGDILHAAQNLTHHDAVMIPAHDGGYTLLGIKPSALRLLENITWGTSVVAQQTRQRATDGLPVSLVELPPIDDVDTFDGLQALLGRLEKSNDDRQRNLYRRLLMIPR
ncbi:MAG: DUF2064 domain-containing protein [Phycisphaerae bacterium]|nr:DUF2064 domain-containing protein [Phycisphaerae bacterium]